MKNKISDLRNHMFAALERLSNEDLSADDLKIEIARSQAVSEVGKIIVESAKTEILFAKVTGGKVPGSAKYLEEPEEEDPIKIERPKAEYSNPNFA